MSEESENTEKAGPSDAGEIAAAYIAAWRGKEFDALRSLLADDFSYAGPLATLDDADKCRESLERMSPVTTDLVVERVFVSESDVVTWFTLHTSIAPPTPVANWIHVEDGKINRIRAVYDPRALLSD
ncbi:nuclear transport factor 2 family protein [Streptomyces sp. ISL-66]|uniref:nuclear transport factor 2 family protein n=1 Tax=Streptomyces sp. ISL-66 TaxID=2819186 RepID=UPI001BE9997A|nr:nuclear transport factor 2 family protein [Streptomyces sp. ISL-66]MBT2472228.1 nuclear transport factor 2 family protein [Streptomyces sp. ISL-66]